MKKFYEISVTSPVARFLRSAYDTERQVAKWLLDSLELMTSDPRAGDTSVVSQDLHLYRTNIGDYKVIYQVQPDELKIVILAIERRRGR
jgi:mRNA-degrading endonuclease RelE of RelBE toxin-antitoxin system